MKIKLTFRIWLLIILLIFSLLSIFSFPPTFLKSGVLITSVEPNSTALNQGLRQGQIIKSIDGNPVKNIADFSAIVGAKFPTNESKKIIFTTDNSSVIIYFSNETPQVVVSNVPKSNLQLGLDLVGGARALVQAQGVKLSQSQVSDLVSITQNRLNEFGLTDLKVTSVSDLSGNNYMLIEIAGSTPNDLRSLISQQGKFEAKIGNQTVFQGGKSDIASVCRGDQTCASVNAVNPTTNGYVAQFAFEITLNGDAANRHAAITKNLAINSTSQGRYLNQTLDLYVDDQQVDSLLISADLQGRVTTQVSVSGSGTGATQNDAVNAAEANMHKLQTILITGSLPYKLEIVKLDTISPNLGSEFTRLILLAGLMALIGASLVVLVRYRKIKASLALIFTSFSEVIIILGIAALIQWNLDLPSIAGILATIGTGFDDQIVILDEASHEKTLSIKQRLKRAFVIIIGAYFTAAVSMLPLLWAGAGLLKGFAFTTLIGITAGVFITRPAFSDMIEKMNE